MILSELDGRHDLAELIVKFKWQEDARKTLMRGLGRNDYLPGDWIKAVAMLEDTATYPALQEFLANGANPATTYDHIKDLQGLPNLISLEMANKMPFDILRS